MAEWRTTALWSTVWMGSHRACLAFGFLRSPVSESRVACSEQANAVLACSNMRGLTLLLSCHRLTLLLSCHIIVTMAASMPSAS